MLVSFLFLALACSGGDHAHGEGADHEHAATAPGHDHAAPGAAHDHAAPAGHDHDATPHAHGATHGGVVKTVGGVHVEALLAPSGVMVWLRDAAEAPLAPASFAGTALVEQEGAVQNVPLAPMGEHLHAQVALTMGKPASAVITIPVEGKPQAVSFEVASVGLAEHDHTALHGGVVSMWGDVHLEYAPKDGQHRFFVSDAKRVTITQGVSGSVKDGTVTTPLTFDAATGLLSAPMAAGQTGDVTAVVTVAGTSFELAFPRK
jgi:hypothetical protein